MGKIKAEEMDLALDTTDDPKRFPEVDLGMARRMQQRHEHLSDTHAGATYITLHRRIATIKTMLVTKAIIDPLCCVTLLTVDLQIIGEDLIDDARERIQLWPLRRAASPITWWFRILANLTRRLPRYPKTTSGLATAMAFNEYETTNRVVDLHRIHPPTRPLPNRKDPALPLAGFYTADAVTQRHRSSDLISRRGLQAIMSTETFAIIDDTFERR